MEKYTSYTYYQKRVEHTNKAFILYNKYRELRNGFIEEEMARKQAMMQESSFDKVKESWMHEHNEVIRHFPPQYLIGKHLNEDTYSLEPLAVYDDEIVNVKLCEAKCEYIYSNPTGFFNLSIAEKSFRTKNYQTVSY